MLKIIIFLFLPFSIFGAEKEVFGFCFNRSVSLNQVRAHIDIILAPGDKVYKRESVNCLELLITARRQKLFRNWLTKKYPISDEYAVSQRGGSVPAISTSKVSNQHCKFEFLRTMKDKLDTTKVEVGSRSGIRKTENRGSGELVSNLMLLEGRKGSIDIGDQEVYLTCNRSGSRYILDVNIKGLDSSLMTSVEVFTGQKLNIGDIVEKINRKNREINSKGFVGGSLEKSKGQTTYNYFITLK